MRYPFRHAIPALAAIGMLLVCGRAGFADDADAVRVKYESGETELGTLREGVALFSNKDFPLQNIPEDALGLAFTRRPYHTPVTVNVDVPAGATVFVLIDSDQNQVEADRCPELIKKLASSGWTNLGDAVYIIRNKNRFQSVFEQKFGDAQRLVLTGGGFSGIVVAAKNLVLDTDHSNGGKKPEPPPDTPEPATTLHIDATPDTTALPGPTTRPALAQSSISALEIYERDNGMMLGQTSETTLTLTGSATPQMVAVRFVTKVGDEMCLARDDALRYIRLKYPNWYIGKAEITFEDKYVAHDGGSIGAAIGTMILSCIQGFTIDSDAAITGDISANGKVRAIGGVSAKIKGATASKCTLVAIPADNLDQLTDAVIYNGPELMSDIQVIGIANLDDAVATLRTDRDPKLTQAITLFAAVQKTLKARPASLHGKDVQATLQQVLDLAPQHLSAQVLLAIAQGKQPKTLSATASQYYTYLAVNSMADVLKARADASPAPTVPSGVVQSGLASLRKLRPIADPQVRPLIDDWSNFLSAWNEFQEGLATPDSVESRRQVVIDEMAKENADADLMQKMLREGM